jgi:N-terminal half of MaoC dehydratase
MAEGQPVVTEAMRAKIGVSSEPWTVEVEKTAVRMFARSVGYTDPVFYDEAAAKSRGYRSLVAPPGYLGTPIFKPSGTTRGAPQLDLPFNRRLNGGTEVVYLDDICAGDVLTATSHISEIEETAGRLGPMVIVTTETVYRRGDQVVARLRGTGIRY